MKPRRKRLLWVLAGVALVGLAVTLVLRALDANVMFFYSPSQIHAGEAPQGAAFRIGGLVEVGSLQRSADGLQVQFMVTDEVQRVPVRYQGLLPDLFREGKGVVASGKLQAVLLDWNSRDFLFVSLRNDLEWTRRVLEPLEHAPPRFLCANDDVSSDIPDPPTLLYWKEVMARCWPRPSLFERR